MSYFGKHMACLALTFVRLDEKGNPAGDIQAAYYIGFIMSVRGTWPFATAGHNIKEIEDVLRRRQIRIVVGFSPTTSKPMLSTRIRSRLTTKTRHGAGFSSMTGSSQ